MWNPCWCHGHLSDNENPLPAWPSLGPSSFDELILSWMASILGNLQARVFFYHQILYSFPLSNFPPQKKKWSNPSLFTGYESAIVPYCSSPHCSSSNSLAIFSCVWSMLSPVTCAPGSTTSTWNPKNIRTSPAMGVRKKLLENVVFKTPEYHQNVLQITWELWWSIGSMRKPVNHHWTKGREAQWSPEVPRGQLTWT